MVCPSMCDTLQCATLNKRSIVKTATHNVLMCAFEHSECAGVFRHSVVNFQDTFVQLC